MRLCLLANPCSISFRKSAWAQVTIVPRRWPDHQFVVTCRHVIEKVPPGERQIYHKLSFRDGKQGIIPATHAMPLIVRTGETTQVTIGGTGRPIVGRVAVVGYDQPIDWRGDVHYLTLKLPDPSEKPRPNRADFATQEALLAAHRVR